MMIVSGRKTGYICDNPFYSREPDEVKYRNYTWCVDKGFHKWSGKRYAEWDYKPDPGTDLRKKRIELAFKERSFVDFNFMVACENGPDPLACGRNLLFSGKAPECNQLVTDRDNDGVCDKLDDCMWDPQNEKDNSGACVVNSDVRCTL